MWISLEAWADWQLLPVVVSRPSRWALALALASNSWSSTSQRSPIQVWEPTPSTSKHMHAAAHPGAMHKSGKIMHKVDALGTKLIVQISPTLCEPKVLFLAPSTQSWCMKVDAESWLSKLMQTVSPGVETNSSSTHTLCTHWLVASIFAPKKTAKVDFQNLCLCT